MMVNLRNLWSLSQTNHQWKGSMVKKTGWIGVDWGPGALKFMKIPKFQTIKTPKKNAQLGMEVAKARVVKSELSQW